MRLLTVPLALAGGPPGLPVLHPVLLAPGQPEHVLLPVGLERGGSRHLVWDVEHDVKNYICLKVRN